jgi:methionyl-tRNA synthetase
MPKATGKLWNALCASLGRLEDQRIGNSGNWGQLIAGSQVQELEALFPRLDEAK